MEIYTSERVIEKSKVIATERRPFVPFILQILLVFLIPCALLYAVYHCSDRTEDLIIGNWEEKSWRYEKANKLGNYSISKKLLDEEVVDVISKDLLIHKTEYWMFHPNGILKLKKKGGEAIYVNWKLKGRGNLLKLKYNNKVTEYYQVVKLSKKNMVLFFENDVHTRGIVKIEFKKL